MEMKELTLEKFEEASEIVEKVTQETKLIFSEYFSSLSGNKVYFKPENMQRTGAYKVRGAYYKISQLSDQEKEKGLITASAGNHAQGVAYAAPENMQRTGAYKVRGAYYKISQLSDQEKEKGLITASAGNHAQGVAYAARLAGVKATVVMPVTTPLIKVQLSDQEKEKGLITASAGNHAQGVAYAARLAGVKATVVMPVTTPLIKVNRTKSLGADVVLSGNVFDEACAHAYELAEEHGYTFVHPFNDLQIATGQGSIAMEIIKELPTVDYILVPVGGGGLCTGVSTLAKLLNPKVKVIAVEPAGAACLKASLEAGKVVSVPAINTIADGTAVQTPGDKLFPYLQANVDEVITIEDSELTLSFLDMAENHKMIVENSGLLTVAALKHLDFKGKKVVSVLSGGNMEGQCG